jgi:undecaprenyl-diphosphatase
VSVLQALALAALQGVSELFPISSLGHTVIVPAILHWRIDRTDPSFLAFVVALHLGTALALLLFYRKDWSAIGRALVASVVRGRLSAEPAERIGWLLVIGTIPVGIFGVFLEKPVRALFGSTAIVAVFLVANAFVMFAGEWLKRREHQPETRPLASLRWGEALAVGASQSLALLPGISRSGSSIVAGLVLGLDHAEAARYSFLLATPAIAAASLLEIPRLFEPSAQAVAGLALGGGVLAGLTAYASVAFLTRYFRSNDLRPFGWYCLAVGLVTLALTLAKVIA